MVALEPEAHPKDRRKGFPHWYKQMQCSLRGGLTVGRFERSLFVYAVGRSHEAIPACHCRFEHLFHLKWMQMGRVDLFRTLQQAWVRQVHLLAAAAEEKLDRDSITEGSWAGPVNPRRDFDRCCCCGQLDPQQYLEMVISVR